MNYQETLSFIFEQLPMYQRQGSPAFKKNLNNIIRLCDHLDNPESKFESIHIAGTNGKGSTAHCLACMFQSAGYKTGVYTSPHYKDFRERIKINGNFISRSKVTQFVNRNLGIIQKIKPSFFEITVAMSFDYFAQQNVDIAIIETGLGGRLDSTNIIHPKLSVITNISLDHTNMLGNTYAQIAFEKAGIIKTNTPVIIGEKSMKTMAVFMQKAKDMNAELYFAQQLIEVSDKGQSKRLVKDNKNEILFETDLRGQYQNYNLQTSLATLTIWNKYYPKQQINIQSCIKSLSQVITSTKFMGRMQQLQSNPTILVDSAHNESGVSHLMSELEEYTFKRLHFVLAFVKEKDLSPILRMFPKSASYYFSKAKIPRGLEAENLKNQANTYELNGRTYVSVKNALKAAKRAANSADLIVVCGSIFAVSEVI